MIKKYLLYLIIVVLLLLVGFIRDFVFVNLNYQASLAYYHQVNEYKLPSIISFIEGWSYKKLYISKWLLTILFTVVYFTISYFSVKQIFKEKSFSKVVIYIYLVLIFFSMLSYLVGYFTDYYTKGYSISRQLMGILQSPIVLMFLLPALYLNKKKA